MWLDLPFHFNFLYMVTGLHCSRYRNKLFPYTKHIMNYLTLLTTLETDTYFVGLCMTLRISLGELNNISAVCMFVYPGAYAYITRPKKTSRNFIHRSMKTILSSLQTQIVIARPTRIYLLSEFILV